MPKGIGITPEQKEYILKHHESKFYKQLAGELGLSAPAVRKVVREHAAG